MNCMKCGRETPSEQVFCEDCLLEMEKYPVKPGTVVFMPRRRETASPKKIPKRRSIPLEEQVKILKKRIKWLILSLIVCVALIAALAYPAYQYFMEDSFKIGQNYNTVSPVSSQMEDAESGN